MSLEVVEFGDAAEDRFVIADYLAEHASTETSDRFVDAVYEAYNLLVEMPLIGSPCHFRAPRYHGMRSWPVPGFWNYLIFYQPTDEELIIRHILQRSQNISIIFGETTD